MTLSRETIARSFQDLQESICTQLEAEDGKASFGKDSWERPGGGGGLSRAIVDGAAIEKGGVNFSAVHGEAPPQLQQQLKIDKGEFFATGVSIVLHPQNPFAPTIHMNVRYFEMKDGPYWFGGGIDLTPSYIDEEEAKYFHSTLKEVCDAHDETFYPRFKDWADDYFYIPHRGETRGVGGVFFDHLNADNGITREQIFNFVMDLGKSFAPIYTNILSIKKSLPFTEENRNWQLIRRGRYVEFNLVHDRGTKFGLETNGRIESILMSMPAEARWEYNHQVESGSPEEESLKYFRKGINWI